MLSLFLPSISSVKTKGVSFSVMCSCVISKLGHDMFQKSSEF